MSHRRKIVIITAVVLFCGLIFIAFILPLIVRGQLEKQINIATDPIAEQSQWLKIVYEKEKFPRPRTVIGTLKTLPDEEMKKLILANTLVSEQQLRALARERSLAVINFLIKDGKLSPDRLFEKSADPFAGSEKGGAVGGRVEFGVVAR